MFGSVVDTDFFLCHNNIVMAANLRKYKYSGPQGSRPSSASDQSSAKTRTTEPEAPPSPTLSKSDIMADLKTEVLLELKADISTVIKKEIKEALAEDFGTLKLEIQSVKTALFNNTTALRADMGQVQVRVNDMEDGLSTWSDEVVALRDTVAELKTEVKALKEKNEDMEGRMRRCNVRILGVPETESSSTLAVANMLKDVLQLDKEPLVDRSHRSPGQKKPGGRPRVIVAKLHYYQDCVDVLRRARTRGPLHFKGTPITIAPDFTISVAKARAEFTGVRRLLRDRPGVRYGLLYPARLRVTHGEEDVMFVDPDVAMAYVKEKILPTPGDGE